MVGVTGSLILDLFTHSTCLKEGDHIVWHHILILQSRWHKITASITHTKCTYKNTHKCTLYKKIRIFSVETMEIFNGRCLKVLNQD